VTDHEGFARRAFLKQVATVAGSARLAPVLIGGAAAGLESGAAHAQAPARAHQETNHETEKLAAYAASLRFEDLPPAVVQRAKDCMTDSVAAIIYGAELPWSKMIIAYARGNSPAGRSYILGSGGPPVHAGAAALSNGSMAHAFELDSLTKPDSGSHPGATVFTAALAVAQDRGLSGRELLTGFVAGAESMFRIGHATKHTQEVRGFHAPGTTGPFGAAAATGRLFNLDAAKMANALGIAGSCASGLLEFAHAGNGAMVKRLHMGRAAEAGILAGNLASAGFTGPTSVLEGDAGFLKVYCTDWDLAELTKGFGSTYFTLEIMLKRYACHITAHNPVEAILDLKNEHKFTAADVASIDVLGNARMAGANNIPAPPDQMLAQYSIPFSVALALYRNPVDPTSFDEAVVHDRAILDMSSRVRMPIVAGQDRRDLTATVTVRLKDGREFSRKVTSFKGTPERPLAQPDLKEKFLMLTKRLDRAKTEALFDRLQNIENEKSLDWLSV
jgi:2-methylcitrate dehydratase PrpD